MTASGYECDAADVASNEGDDFFQETWDWNDDSIDKKDENCHQRRKPRSRQNSYLRSQTDVFGKDVLNMDPWAAESIIQIRKKAITDSNRTDSTALSADPEKTDNSSNSKLLEEGNRGSHCEMPRHSISRSPDGGRRGRREAKRSKSRSRSSLVDQYKDRSDARVHAESSPRQRSRSTGSNRRGRQRLSRSADRKYSNESRGTQMPVYTDPDFDKRSPSRKCKSKRERSLPRCRSVTRQGSTNGLERAEIHILNMTHTIGNEFFSPGSIRLTVDGRGRPAQTNFRIRSQGEQRKSPVPQKKSNEFFSPASIKLSVNGKPKPSTLPSSYVSVQDQKRTHGLHSESEVRRKDVKASLAKLFVDLANDTKLLGSNSNQSVVSVTNESIPTTRRGMHRN